MTCHPSTVFSEDEKQHWSAFFIKPRYFVVDVSLGCVKGLLLECLLHGLANIARSETPSITNGKYKAAPAVA